LSKQGPRATSYRELERYAKDSAVARAIFVTDANDTIVKAYPRPDFFLGRTLKKPYAPDSNLPYHVYRPRGEGSAANQIAYLMGQAGLGTARHDVHIEDIVTDKDEIVGRIFVQHTQQFVRNRWAEQMHLLSIISACLSFAAYWLPVALWVFADARANRQRAFLWGAFALFTNLIGLLVYLLVKSTTPRLCPRCHRAMEEHFNVCPYCGPVRTRLCEKCGSLVQSDWNFCPVCQMLMREKAELPEMAAGGD
jgi:RNA polymerase subunit RPABC4/transcription elongation factor Spt4